MTDLLSELEAVVQIESDARFLASEGEVRQAAQLRRLIPLKAATFLRTHHAEIAAAVRDKRRLDWLERDCTDIPDELGMARQLYFGTYSSGQTLREAVDTAMRAGEGDG